MKIRSALSSFVLLHVSAVAYAQDCAPGARPSFNFQNQEAELHNAVYEVDAGWQGKWKDLPQSEQLKQQDSTIARISAQYADRHRGSPGRENCVVGLSNPCASAQGDHPSCAKTGRSDAGNAHLSPTLETRGGDSRSSADYYGLLR